MEDPVYPLARNLYGHPLAGLLWERQFEKVPKEHGWENFYLGMFICHPSKRTILLSVGGRYQKCRKTANLGPTWKFLLKDVDLEEATSFLDHENFGCTQRECKISNDIVGSYRDMFESRISAEAKENYLPELQGNLMQKSYFLGPTTWKVMQRFVWKDIANMHC